MDTQPRLHALDAVRAFALLSGILLHATMTFMPGLAAVGFPADVSQSNTLQIVFYVIHVFRMTLFFFIAGFFAHLMLARKGTAVFIKDRAKRILLPFILGWVCFGPIAMVSVGMVLGPSTAAPPVAPAEMAFPLSHLWFLHYLLMFYLGTLVLRTAFERFTDRSKRTRRSVDAAVRWLATSPLAPALIAMPLVICFYLTPNWIMFSGIASPDMGLAPRLLPLVGFGTAFLFGWLLNRQSDVLAAWKNRWLLHLGVAVASTALCLWLLQLAPNPFAVAPVVKFAYAASYGIAMWSWVIGLVGAAQVFFHRESAWRRYLADASYWMYLAHLPLVFALQLTVLDWPLHWSLKFPLIVVTATVLLLGSYHFLVRRSFIGQLLSGKRFTAGEPEPTAKQAASNNNDDSQIAANLR